MKKILGFILCTALLAGCSKQINKEIQTVVNTVPQTSSSLSVANMTQEQDEKTLSDEVCNEIQNILDDKLIDKKKETPEGFGNKEHSLLALIKEERMFAKDAEIKSLVKGYGKQVKLGKVMGEKLDITDKFRTQKPKVVLRVMSTCPSCKKMLNILKDVDIDNAPYELLIQVYDKDLLSRKNTLAEIFKIKREGGTLPDELINREVIENEETRKQLAELSVANTSEKIEEIIAKIAKIENIPTDLQDSIKNIPDSLQKYIVYCDYKITDGILKINRYPSTIFLTKDKKLYDIGGCLTNDAIVQRIEDIPEFPEDYKVEDELQK